MKKTPSRPAPPDRDARKEPADEGAASLDPGMEDQTRRRRG